MIPIDRAAIVVHPAASIFPMMGDAELRALAEDIKANGQREPIRIMYDVSSGRASQPLLLDGRNRLAACELAGVAPWFCDEDDVDDGSFSDATKAPPDPISYVLSANLHRRQLRAGQRALCAARTATLKLGDNQHSDDEGRSIGQASELFGVSESSVKRAKRFLDAKPAEELVAAVDAGEVAISAALLVATERTPAQQREYLENGTLDRVVASIRRERQKAQPGKKSKYDRPPKYDHEFTRAAALRATALASSYVTHAPADKRADLTRTVVAALRAEADKLEQSIPTQEASS